MVTGGALMVYVLCASRTASSLQIYPPPVRSLRDRQPLEDAPEERLRIAVEARLQRRGLAAILVVDAGDACDVRRLLRGWPRDHASAGEPRPRFAGAPLAHPRGAGGRGVTGPAAGISGAMRQFAMHRGRTP